jgi:hypothetical protein
MKFSIRDLFLATVIVAVLVAWWADHRRLNQQVEKANDAADAYFSELTRIRPPPTPLPNP